MVDTFSRKCQYVRAFRAYPARMCSLTWEKMMNLKELYYRLLKDTYFEKYYFR